MLMISLLNWIEPILSSWKEKNVLVLLKYQDPFIKYVIFESYSSCFIIIGAQNFSTIQWIVDFHTIPCWSNGLSSVAIR